MEIFIDVIVVNDLTNLLGGDGMWMKTQLGF